MSVGAILASLGDGQDGSLSKVGAGEGEGMKRRILAGALFALVQACAPVHEEKVVSDRRGSKRSQA